MDQAAINAFLNSGRAADFLKSLSEPKSKVSKTLDDKLNEVIFNMLISNVKTDEEKIEEWADLTAKEKKAMMKLGEDSEEFKKFLEILPASADTPPLKGVLPIKKTRAKKVKAE